jgi:predicted nucleic acid-binding protein
VFVFANAFVRNDPAKAREWWERLEAAQTQDSHEGRWISLSALLLRENRLEEAREAWRKADAWTRTRPSAGMWEGGLAALGKLRQALDEARVVA